MKTPDTLARQLDQAHFVCGADEVGLGAWAGQLVVCAAVVPKDWTLAGLTDSKKLTNAARERIYPMLVSSVPHAIVGISAAEIDEIGVGRAWEKAHAQAIQKALDDHRERYGASPLVIIDGNRSVLGAVALPKADLLIPAVSAASVIAKVHRDRIMRDLAKQWPEYGFDRHVGYGTPQHQKALQQFGVTPIHRMSYTPMSKMKTLQPTVMDLIDEIGD